MAGRRTAVAEHTRAGQFSPVSMAAARLIARRAVPNPRLLAAYLALARQTSMHDEGGHGRNRVTGAGANKIAQVVGCQWPRARVLEQALAEACLIRKAPRGLPAGRMSQARWILADAGDVPLPHALVDGHGDASSGLRRLLDSGQPDPVVLCALVLLLECYARHDLERSGGVDPALLWREWSWTSRFEPADKAWLVRATPGTAKARTDWMRGFLDGIGLDFGDAARAVFWSAFELLTGCGLLYEAVSVLSGDQAVVTVRLNDYHAATGEGEEELIASTPGVGYYVNARADRQGRPESCSFYWPSSFEPHVLKGVWRLRFRCATPQTAVGLLRDSAAIDRLREQLESLGTLERV